MFMRTSRLFLRPPFEEDWQAVHRALSDSRVVGMLPRAPWPYTEGDAKAWCAAATGQSLSDEIRFVVTLPGADGAPVIGGVALRPVMHAMELSCWIASEYAGQGFGTEAVRGAVEVAHGLGFTRVEAGHLVDNPASAKMLQKAGFKPTGEVHPRFCAGRGGDMVLVRRYAIDQNMLKAASPRMVENA